MTISKEDLLMYGKALFNFHPDEEFSSLEDLLYQGRKAVRQHEGYYDNVCRLLAVRMAYYIDGDEL